MHPRTLRIAVSVIVAVIAIGAAASKRNSQADTGVHELTPAVKAAGFSFDSSVTDGDRQWILAAIAQARPEAQQLIGAIDGLVTIRTVNEPNAPYVGVAEQGTNDVSFNVAFLNGERVADRTSTVLHELGHVIDFELIPEDQMKLLAEKIPSSGACLTAETGDCTVPEERFADTFAKWALRGAVSTVGAGYSVMSPASLEEWGAPLGLLAAQMRLSA